MKDSTLLTIALVGSIGGLIALFFIMLSIEPHDIIVNLEQHERDETIQAQGKIIKTTKNGEITRLQIQSKLSIPVVVFEDLDLVEGNEIEIVGEISDYKGKREVIARSIKRI